MDKNLRWRHVMAFPIKVMACSCKIIDGFMLELSESPDINQVGKADRIKGYGSLFKYKGAYHQLYKQQGKY